MHFSMDYVAYVSCTGDYDAESFVTVYFKVFKKNHSQYNVQSKHFQVST
jgi:hypothetical protein